MNISFRVRLTASLLFVVALMAMGNVVAQDVDTSAPIRDSSMMRYPLKDRRGDFITWRNKNVFDLPDKGLIDQKVEYDPKTKRYFISEKIGGQWFRKPTYLTFDEFTGCGRVPTKRIISRKGPMRFPF